MKFKIKKLGLFGPKKEAHKVEIKEIYASKALNLDQDLVNICFKSNKVSGIIQISKDELAQIAKFSK